MDPVERAQLALDYEEGRLPAPSWSVAVRNIRSSTCDAVASGASSQICAGVAGTPLDADVASDAEVASDPSRPDFADWPPTGRWASQAPPPMVSGGYEAGVAAGYRAGYLAAIHAAVGAIGPAHPDICAVLLALSARADGPIPMSPRQVQKTG